MLLKFLSFDKIFFSYSKWSKLILPSWWWCCCLDVGTVETDTGPMRRPSFYSEQRLDAQSASLRTLWRNDARVSTTPRSSPRPRPRPEPETETWKPFLRPRLRDRFRCSKNRRIEPVSESDSRSRSLFSGNTEMQKSFSAQKRLFFPKKICYFFPQKSGRLAQLWSSSLLACFTGPF